MRLLICLVLFACPLSAMAVYKCETGKKSSAEPAVTYSDKPCVSGNSSKIDTSESTLSIVHGTDEQRLERQKAEARRLERNRHRREAEEDKQAQKTAKANAARQRKCSRLALQQKWREEDAAKAAGRSVERARLRARRAAEEYQLECR